MSKQLLHKWTFWMIDSKVNSEYQIQTIKVVNTVANFWDTFHALPEASRLVQKQDRRISYGFFKDSIRPAWEDPMNKNGGSYQFTCSQKNVDNIWKIILLYCIGEQFNKEFNVDFEICGVTCLPKFMNTQEGMVFNVLLWVGSPAEVPGFADRFASAVCGHAGCQNGLRHVKFLQHNQK